MDFTDLLKRIQRGDEAAFMELIRSYGEGVYRCAFRQSHDKKFAAAITRQTMEELFSRLRDDPDVEPGAVLLETLADKNIGTSRLIAGEVEKIGAELTDALFGNERQAPPRVLRAGAANAKRLPPRYAERAQGECLRPPKPQGPPPVAADRVLEPAPTPFIQEELAPSAMTSGRPRRKEPAVTGRFALIVLLLALILILAWMALGILMKLGVLPSFDLGYEWFNAHIVTLF